MRTLFDVLSDFSVDIQGQSGLPEIAQDSPLIDEPSIRFRLNNPDEQAAEMAGSLTYLTGEINLQISHELGANDFVMYSLASQITAIYQRPYKFGETVVTSCRTSSVYSSESNQHISVVIGFFAVSANDVVQDDEDYTAWLINGDSLLANGDYVVSDSEEITSWFSNGDNLFINGDQIVSGGAQSGVTWLINGDNLLVNGDQVISN